MPLGYGVLFDLLPIDWTAIGAVATLLAVGVALWMPFRLRRPKLVGTAELRIGPKDIDMYGDETPYTSADEPWNWIESEEVPKRFDFTIYNYSESPAWIAGFYLKHGVLKKMHLETFVAGAAHIGPQGQCERVTTPLFKADYSKLKKIWVSDTMRRKWRLDMGQIRMLQREYRKAKGQPPGTESR